MQITLQYLLSGLSQGNAQLEELFFVQFAINIAGKVLQVDKSIWLLCHRHLGEYIEGLGPLLNSGLWLQAADAADQLLQILEPEASRQFAAKQTFLDFASNHT